MHYIILARDDLAGNALLTALQALDPSIVSEPRSAESSEANTHEGPDSTGAHPRSGHAFGTGPSMSAYGVQCFNVKTTATAADDFTAIANLLEKAITAFDDFTPRELEVVVDEADFARLDPLAERGWESVIAGLILAFPELSWKFGWLHTQDSDASSTAVWHARGLPSVLTSEVDPLFDARGLRDAIRGHAQSQLDHEQLGQVLPRRHQLAVAIDDEPAYGYFNAYCAYRFGYRALVVDSERKLLATLGKDGEARTDLGLTIEDLFLNFPDRSKDRGPSGRAVRWSDLDERSRFLPLLERFRPLRVFLTTGHRKGTATSRRRRNQNISKSLAREGRLGTVVRKPFAGVFDVWSRSGLATLPRRTDFTEGYQWPPTEPTAQETAGGSHSAPGRLMQIAERLISRAERIRDAKPKSVEHAVYAAVLATDALELLGARTPTTALRALSLKHEMEVMAECEFHGVGAHFDVGARMADIRTEINALAYYFSPRVRRLSTWSAEAAILGRLVKIFRKCGQFDEELRIQTRNRWLHARMWFKKVRWWGWFGDHLRHLNPAYWVVRYVNLLIDSLPRFLVCIAFWIGLLALLRHLVVTGSPPAGGALSHIAEALSAFLGPTRPHETESPGGWLYFSATLIATCGGALHFGILISHLYALLARK